MITGNGEGHTQNQLILRSRLSDIAQVPAWIENLASNYALPENIRFAMDLCLEEALSNIIHHAYGRESDRPVTVRFLEPRKGDFVLVIEDEAPRFNPLDAPELPALNPREEIRIGGQGLRLLRRFADTLEYEPTPTGNRLRMRFSIAGSAVRAKA